MRRSTPWALIPAGLFLLTACPLIEPPSFDAGSLDAGIDEACAMQSARDSGVLITACNPADGTRCDVSRMQACTWDVLKDEGECSCSSQRQPLGAACNLGRQDCAPGTTCLFFAGSPEPTCQSVCNLGDGTGCEQEQALAPDNAYACVPVRRGTPIEPTTTYGVCFNVGTACDPLDDRCPAAEKCSLLGQTTACADRGPRQEGERCDDNAYCDRGTLCVALASMSGATVPPTCYVPCDLNAPVCNMGSCANIGLEFGICFEP